MSNELAVFAAGRTLAPTKMAAANNDANAATRLFEIWVFMVASFIYCFQAILGTAINIAQAMPVYIYINFSTY